MNAPLLHVQNLSVAFGPKTVVDGVGFSIAPGEKLALVGESGSGKTVTALALLRLLHGARVSGQALFNDGQRTRDLLALSERELRGLRGDDIAMIFQEPMTALNPLMSVGEQIAEVLRLKRAITPAQSAQAAIELLAKTGIPEAARRASAFPHQLSGGQRQRAMIAMALACEPKLLLADEPTTALDVSLRQGGFARTRFADHAQRAAGQQAQIGALQRHEFTLLEPAADAGQRRRVDHAQFVRGQRGGIARRGGRFNHVALGLAGHQLLRVGVLRRAEDVGGGAMLHQAAVLHHRHAVG